MFNKKISDKDFKEIMNFIDKITDIKLMKLNNKISEVVAWSEFNGNNMDDVLMFLLDESGYSVYNLAYEMDEKTLKKLGKYKICSRDNYNVIIAKTKAMDKIIKSVKTKKTK